MDRNGDSSLEANAATPDAAAEETSALYVARWNHLISTTNWEKGRIVSQWRQAMIEAEGASHDYSDEAWSSRLQSVTPQHVGRLRRVWERFGDVYTDYDGLYWSHFQAALDWDDAEMWLEGAARSDWSISAMRRQRATTLAETSGETVADDIDPALDNPAADVADSSAGDDFDDSESVAERATTSRASSEAAEGDDESAETSDDSSDDDGEGWVSNGVDDGDHDEPIRPFAALAELPADLADAFESFKLAILRHKVTGWSEIARDDIVDALDALKQLALAPSE